MNPVSSVHGANWVNVADRGGIATASAKSPGSLFRVI